MPANKTLTHLACGCLGGKRRESHLNRLRSKLPRCRYTLKVLSNLIHQHLSQEAHINVLSERQRGTSQVERFPFFTFYFQQVPAVISEDESLY